MPHRSGSQSTIEDLIAGSRTTFRSGFGGILTICADGAAPINVDGRGDLCIVSADPIEAGYTPDCTWRADGETLLRIFRGARAFESAYLSGRLNISGDMAIMRRLQMERGATARTTEDRRP